MKNNRGFTMIEMMLAMTFVSFLMVAIAMTTISMGRTYEKGLTISNVNQAGRAIISDIQASLQQSSSAKSRPPSSASPWSALCFGGTSYVYNTGSAIADSNPSLLKYSDGDRAVVRLAKVNDSSGSFCDTGPAPAISSTNATELLPSGERNLAMRSMKVDDVTPAGVSSGQKLYKVNFTLGTNDQNALLASGDCKPPSDVGSDLEYCAVNNFEFIVRTVQAVGGA